MSVIKRQTIIGTIWSYAGVMIGTATQAFLIPNYFTEEQNGLLQILLSWMIILVLFADLGYGIAGTKFFPSFRDNSKKHKGFLFTGFMVVTIGLLLTFTFLFFFKNSITNSLQTSDNELFEKYYFILFPIIIGTAYFNLLSNYAKGLYDTVLGNFLSQFLQRLLILFSVVLYIMDWVNFNQFIALWTISIFLQFPIMLWHSYKLGNFSLKPFFQVFTPKFRKKFINYAGFSIAIGLSSIVVTRLDTLMVHQYLGLANTGIYGTCLLFGSVMMMSYQVSMKASSAIIIDALEAEDHNKIETIFKKSGLTQLIFGLILFTLVVSNIDLLFSFIKPSYSAGKWVLIIIGIAKLIDLAFGINSLILVYSKHYKKDAILVILFVGILFVLNHLLIPRYGLNGAALAALFSTILFNFGRNTVIFKYFKIHSFSSHQLKALFIGAFVLTVGIFLPNFELGLWQKIATLTYKSIIILSLFILLIRITNISKDLSELVDSLYLKFRPLLTNRK